MGHQELSELQLSFFNLLETKPLFFTRNFQQRSKTLSHCRVKVSKESFLFPELSFPARGRRGWRSAQGCRGGRRQEAAENLVREPRRSPASPLLPRQRAGTPPSPNRLGATGPRSLLSRGRGCGSPQAGWREEARGRRRRLRREKESSRSLPALPKLETADSGGTKPPAPRYCLSS